jgi:poly(3-hydroxybutyrate) depolymerase
VRLKLSSCAQQFLVAANQKRLRWMASAIPVLLMFPVLHAQLVPMDTQFAGLTARTELLAYQAKGSDMSKVSPLMADAQAPDRTRAYRSLTHAMVLMDGAVWTADAELPTALDFAIGAKLVGTGENLVTRATFLFDAPPAERGPYSLKLDLLKADGSQEAGLEPGIVLGDVRGRKAGETVGFVLDPSRSVQPGLHLLRATLQDGHGTKLYEYYRSFFIVTDLNKRVAALEKTLELLPDQSAAAALSARQTLETIHLAHQTYYGTGFQNLTGFVFTRMRAAGLGSTEAVDFDPALTRATILAASLKEGHDPYAAARKDIYMAYRSSFDGKLVPYRVYVPSNYDPSKKYPLVVLLHGAGGDETNFIEGYRGLWPELAEERGYILAAVSGRGPVTGYSKESGGEQDVLDVAGRVKASYNIDPSRVYLGGHSMGGGGTWRLGLLYADYFAGLIPIAGSAPTVITGYEAVLKTGKQMPVMMVCGVKDALVAVAGCRTVADRAKALSAPLKYAEYADADHLSVAVISIPDIFDWLDAQGKPAKGNMPK